MHTSNHKVENLRAKSLQATVESLSVFIMAIFVSALLPALLVRYYFATQNLMEQPKILEYIPVAAFAVGVGYFIYAMVGNFQREGQIRKLEKQMDEMGCDCEGCDCCDTDSKSELSQALLSTKSVKASKSRKSK